MMNAAVMMPKDSVLKMPDVAALREFLPARQALLDRVRFEHSCPQGANIEVLGLWAECESCLPQVP